jgi:nucleoid-associated protein YgaU
MFLGNSRYAKATTVDATDAGGREVSAVKLRVPPDTQGVATTVRTGEQLDVMSERRYRDGTRYWHIADANTELEANELVRRDGRVIAVPQR